MTNWRDWKKGDAEFAKDFPARMDDMTPEPLFESLHLPRAMICLRCGQRAASSLLYSPFGMQPVLPLCTKCAADWNHSGYHILKSVRQATLLSRLLTFKLMHPLGRPSVFELIQDVQNLLRWVRKMKRLRDRAS